MIYCLPGWEGLTHDSRALEDATSKGFEAPPGRYYLASGYSQHFGPDELDVLLPEQNDGRWII